MKSKRAKEFINNRSELIDGLEWMVDASTARRAVELAEQDAEEKIEALKAIAVEAHRDCCMFRTRKEPLEPDDPFLCEANYHMQGELCDRDCGYMQIFIQKLNER